MVEALTEALLAHSYNTVPLPGMVSVKAVESKFVLQRFIAAYPPTKSTGEGATGHDQQAYDAAFKNLKDQAGLDHKRMKTLTEVKGSLSGKSTAAKSSSSSNKSQKVFSPGEGSTGRSLRYRAWTASQAGIETVRA